MKCLSCKHVKVPPTKLCFFSKEGLVPSIEKCKFYEYSKIVEKYYKNKKFKIFIK